MDQWLSHWTEAELSIVPFPIGATRYVLYSSVYVYHTLRKGRRGGEAKKNKEKKNTLIQSTVSVLHVFIVIALGRFV